MCPTAAGEDCGTIDRYGGSLLVHLTRDHRGRFLVYDERMERLNPDVDASQVHRLVSGHP